MILSGLVKTPNRYDLVEVTLSGLVKTPNRYDLVEVILSGLVRHRAVSTSLR